MAKTKKKRASTKRPVASRPPSAPRSSPHRGWEAVGVLMMLAAVGLCFALLSFDPGDRTGQENLVGRFGRDAADAVLDAVGVIGYLGGLLAVALAGAALFGRLRRPSAVTLLSAALLIVGLTAAAHLLGGNVLGKPAGGVLGLVVGGSLREKVGPVGSGLTAVGAVLLGLMGLADISPARVLGALFSAARTLVESVSDGWAARAAARRRVRAIEAAARAVEARERLAPAGDVAEATRAAEREDRRRAKVIRAAAEAEARTLERLARARAKSGEADDERAEESGSTDRPSPQPVEEPSERPRPPDGLLEDLPPEPSLSLMDAADVLDELDARTPPETEAAGAEAVRSRADGESQIEPTHAEAVETVDARENTDKAALSAGKDDEQSGSSIPLSTPPREADGPMIHERKHAEVSFEEEPERPPVREKEKKIYRLPPLNLLDHTGDSPDPVDQIALRERATRLEKKLETYGVRGKVAAIRPGPVVTTYEYQPAPGVKVSKIANLQDDIAMSMEALRVRIVAPIPGRGVVGIELPNERRENVYLKEIVAHDRFKQSKSILTLALGKDAEGDPQVRDLQKMPHVLVAGTTGSGKSVSINTMILSMLYKATPNEVKLIMVDPKMLELSLYNDIPHLLLPVVTDPRQASLALQWAVDEMERRYQLLSDFKVRDLETFNRKLDRLKAQREADAAQAQAALDHEAKVREAEASGTEPPSQAELPFEDEKKGRIPDPWKGKDIPDPLPYIVVLIDEFADLMTVAPRDVETSVQRLAQKARAAGLHVLLATQRPSTDVITGVIKNNFPCRIAFRVASRHDSATIINMPGAEALLGRGDSLFMDTSSPSPSRIHGSFVSEEEVERVVEFWKEQGRPTYDETILRPREDEENEGGFAPEDVDEHYDLAVRIVTETRRASISALQRRLRVGYNRAARMIEMMEMQGIVGPAVGAKGEREVLVQAIEADGPPLG